MIKKTVILLVLVNFILLSCTKKSQETYSYTFRENAKLNIETYEDSYMKYGRVEEGANLVFEYKYKAEDAENIADDEYSELIRFEIESSLDKFNYSDDELSNINAVFTKECFCWFDSDEKKNVSPTGTISGKKLSETEWDITFDITFYGDELKIISNIFRLKK